MGRDVLCEMENSIQLSIVVHGGHWSSSPDRGTEPEGGGSCSQDGRGRLEVGRTGILVPWDWEPVTGMGSALATGLGAVGVGETTELQ